MSINDNLEKRPISDLLKYSGAYQEMSAAEHFNQVLTPQDARKHPILKDYEIDEFYFKRIKYLPDIPEIDFYNFLTTSFRDVPKRAIIGTNHCSYAGNTWLENLTVLQRGYCKTEEDVLCLIPVEGRPHGGLVELSLYGDEYYVINGNNRITQAQFAPSLTKIPSMVTEYVFDGRRYGLASRIRKIGARLELPGTHKIGAKVTVQHEGISLFIRFDEEGVSSLESAIQQSVQLAGRKLKLFFLSRYHNCRIRWKYCYNLCDPVEKKLAVIKMASMHSSGQS